MASDSTINGLPVSGLLRACGRHVLDRWRPMFGYAVIITALELALFAPLGALVLRWLVTRGGKRIVGNTDIAGWVLSPSGLIFVLISGSLLILGFVMSAAGQYWIAVSKDESVNIRMTVWRVLRSFPQLLRFSAVAFLVALCGVLPLALGAAALYGHFLGAHDINYYLSVHPPEWTAAVALLCCWGALWAVAMITVLFRLAYALPATLDGERQVWRAIRASWVRTRSEWTTVGKTLAVVAVCWLAARLVSYGLLYLTVGMMIEHVFKSVYGLLFGISFYLVVGWIVRTAISIAGLAWLITCVAHLYRGGALDRVGASPAVAGQEGMSGLVKRGLKYLRPSLAVPALLVLLLASGGVTWLSLRGRSVDVDPLVIAHRAGAVYGPENSLSALDAAIKQGADYSEIDVQRTKDGTVVVVHDADLMKAARDPRVVSATRYKALADVDIGSVFGPAFAGERLATLAQHLDRSREGTRVLIELKYYGGDRALVPAVLALVREAGMQNQVSIMSLDLGGVRQAQQEAPDIPVGYLATVSVGNLSQLDVDFLAVSRGNATRSFIGSAHKNGVPVYAWTINDAAGMLDLMDIGIDGIITDDTALAVKTIRQVRSLSPAQRFILGFRDLWDVWDALFDDLG